MRFGFERREEVLSPHAIPVPPHGTVWHTFVFTGLPPIDFPGRLDLPAMIVDGVSMPMPAFEFEIRPWAGFAPINCRPREIRPSPAPPHAGPRGR